MEEKIKNILETKLKNSGIKECEDLERCLPKLWKLSKLFLYSGMLDNLEETTQAKMKSCVSTSECTELVYYRLVRSTRLSQICR